ncbi:zinc-binding dehydrogenase [Rathayibacter sp. VKM Ac-2804]|uniref:zinc-binding dehydrogenase n=1 Tax=Rathayibacter sp. VKM Ac-2804 TaxID=2609257 RepID=UPI0024499F2B|nr:zinc-binding dehydrogenase [Rathayibacter sp. VKM Ac-2804]
MKAATRGVGGGPGEGGDSPRGGGIQRQDGPAEAAVEDVPRHDDLLQEVSGLLGEGVLRTTLTRALSPLNAGTLAQAHRLVEAGGRPGEVVVSGW